MSAPTALPPIEVPSVEVETARDEDAVPEPSTVPSIGVWANSAVVIEPDLSTIVQVVPQVEQSWAQSSIDFMAVLSGRSPTVERGKALATSTDNGSLVDFSTLFDIQISVGESALANLSLARRLIETALLSTDR